MSDWARRAATSGLGVVAALAALAPGWASAAESAASARVAAPVADSSGACEGLRVGRIEVIPHNIYDPIPPGRLAPLYRATNRLHVRTRSSTIREQMLIETGKPYEEEHRAQTLRILRSLGYLEPQRVDSRCEGDSVTIRVETRDGWTTSPEFNLERGGGKQFGSFGLSERNLLGLGKSFSIGYHEDPTGIARSISFTDPSVLGSHHRLHYTASTGTGGSTDILAVTLPFYAPDTPWSYGASWRRTRSELLLFQSAGEIASLDQRVSEIDAWLGRGVERGGTVRRLTASYLTRDRDLDPSRLEPGAPPEFAGGEEHLRQRRVAFEAMLWHPRYIAREGIERIRRVEDYDLGPSFAIRLGLSPYVLGGTADEGDLRVRAGAGVETRFGFGLVRASASARMRRTPLELIRQADARWIWPTRAGHTLVLAAQGIAGSRVARDFQAVVGGLNGLRAYPVQAVAGRQLVRANVEQRWVVNRNLADLLSIGGAVFYDAAHAWGPGAAGTGWFDDAGFGLRFATTRSTIGPALRVDLAWPLSPTRDARREPVFSFGSSQAF